MRKLVQLMGSILGLLAITTSTQAGPIGPVWLAPWGASFAGSSTAGLLAAVDTEAFGIDATRPGQMTNLGAAGDIGLAGAVASTDAQTALIGFNITGPKDAISDVKFWRPFDLPSVDPTTGQPIKQWRVDLSGSLKGLLESTLSSGTASVQVKGVLANGNTGFNLLAPKVNGSALVFNNNPFGGFGIEGELTKTIDLSTSTSVLVAPGTYTFMGVYCPSRNRNLPS
jgi:hypothetical protein